MELAIDRQDMRRILICLAHTAKHFEDEAARHHALATAMLSQPLGLLGAVVSGAVAEMFNDEARQLHSLRARLTTGMDIGPDATASRPFTIA